MASTHTEYPLWSENKPVNKNKGTMVTIAIDNTMLKSFDRVETKYPKDVAAATHSHITHTS